MTSYTKLLCTYCHQPVVYIKTLCDHPLEDYCTTIRVSNVGGLQTAQRRVASRNDRDLLLFFFFLQSVVNERFRRAGENINPWANRLLLDARAL